MNKPDTTLSQSDAEARQRREASERKPVREWSAEQRREAFLESRRVETQKAEAGVWDESELCETCHEFSPERGSWSCKKCIERMRQYED